MKNIIVREEGNFISIDFSGIPFCATPSGVNLLISDEEADKMAHQLSCIVQGHDLAKTGKDKESY